MIIIGITGTLGAGKGTIVEYLVRDKGFAHFSVRAYVSEEIVRRGMPVNRDNMVVVANDLRRQNSQSYIVDMLFERALLSGRNAVIESIRTPGEVESLRKKGRFCLFAVDAPADQRYQRIRQRMSETDFISYVTFLENESREMSSTDPNAQNISACIEMSDYRFVNNGTISQLHQDVERALSQIFKDETI